MAEQNTTSGSGAQSSHGGVRFGGVLVLALMAAACGSGGNGSSGGGSNAPSPTPVAQTTATTDRTVTSAPTTAAPTPSPASTPLPAIAIAHPTPGETVHSPFHVSGTADTFEATFRIQLRDGTGKVLADQQVHATSGTGTRGSFDTVLTTAAHGAATVVAYEVSAKDGSHVNTVTVQITLG